LFTRKYLSYFRQSYNDDGRFNIARYYSTNDRPAEIRKDVGRKWVSCVVE